MNNNSKSMATEEQTEDRTPDKMRTTIGIRLSTRDKLIKSRAPGQSYDGFLCQLVDFWESTGGNSKK